MILEVQYYIVAYEADARCNPTCKDYSDIRFKNIKEVDKFLKENNIKLNELDEHWNSYNLKMTYRYGDFKCPDYI